MRQLWDREQSLYSVVALDQMAADIAEELWRAFLIVPDDPVVEGIRRQIEQVGFIEPGLGWSLDELPGLDAPLVEEADPSELPPIAPVRSEPEPKTNKPRVIADTENYHEHITEAGARVRWTFLPAPVQGRY